MWQYRDKATGQLKGDATVRFGKQGSHGTTCRWCRQSLAPKHMFDKDNTFCMRTATCNHSFIV